MGSLAGLQVGLEAEQLLDAGQPLRLAALDVELDVLAASLGAALALSDAALDADGERVIIGKGLLPAFKVIASTDPRARSHVGKTVPCWGTRKSQGSGSNSVTTGGQVAPYDFARWQFQLIVRAIVTSLYTWVAVFDPILTEHRSALASIRADP